VGTGQDKGIRQYADAPAERVSLKAKLEVMKAKVAGAEKPGKQMDKGKEVTIIRQNPGVMHLDGEPIMADSRIEISVLPKSLNVLTPETVSFTEEVQNLFGEVTRFFDKKLPYIFR